ncbi:hypothetical protein [Romboutsia sp. 1001285H_161024_C4]|uniref:hypothetical protein n=1 Tax=Romboutsia sp. 1001285H_161024_C4 TaxID=2787109 RepID=UPI0018988361|nr:hypothetical protein [Romboutsia sp. 1001285H_161024_C4]
MLFINPKTLEDAKNVIESTMGSMPEKKLEGVQLALDNWNSLYNMISSFFRGCSSIFKFITNCFTDPSFLVDKMQGIAPDVLLVILTILIILKFIGFKDTTKWISLSLVVALIIAFL